MCYKGFQCHNLQLQQSQGSINCKLFCATNFPLIKNFSIFLRPSERALICLIFQPLWDSNWDSSVGSDHPANFDTATAAPTIFN